MITTAYKRIGGGEKMRVTYGMQKLKGNLYAYFSITAESRTIGGRELCGGCMHDEIRAHFPELSHLIKWHLVDENGLPMHYIANAKFHLEHQPWYFADHILLGEVATDYDYDWTQPWNEITCYLTDRIPSLKSHLEEDLRKIS